MISAHLMKDVEKDDYNEGANPDTRKGILSETLYAENMSDLEKQLENYGLDINKFYIFEVNEDLNRLEFARNEDDDGDEITLSESRPEGWIADYSLYLNFYKKIQVDLKEMGFKTD